jgi:hypothetical protein
VSGHKKSIAICVVNSDYEASLILRKAYEIIPDELGAKDDLLRILDESGEDYRKIKTYKLKEEADRSLKEAAAKDRRASWLRFRPPLRLIERHSLRSMHHE